MKVNYTRIYEDGTKTFCGRQVSDEAARHDKVDYYTLSRAFNCVLCNEIMSVQPDNWEIVNGSDYDEEKDTYTDVFQYFIIDSEGYEILSNCTDEIIYYNDNLDLYVWGVTHYGTAWTGVLTDIDIYND